MRGGFRSEIDPPYANSFSGSAILNPANACGLHFAKHL
jgi:hypothetical protein